LLPAMKPTVKNVAIDETNNVTYVVLAYRKLSSKEVMECVQIVLGSKSKKPKRGSTVTIQTVIS